MSDIKNDFYTKVETKEPPPIIIDEWGLVTGAIISSYKLFGYCKSRYPKRKVYASMYPADEDFYYYSRAKQLRLIRNKTEVWVGYDWPRIRRRR